MRLTPFAAIFAVILPVDHAGAQAYPAKPVRYVVAFAAGDSPDIVARLVGDRLTRIWDQQVLVENRVGAGGTIAAAFVAKAPPDGYTLFHCNIASNAIAPALYAKLPYDGLRDFAPVTRIATTSNVLLVHPSMPVKSIAGFIAYAKAKPGTISYGSSGVGSSPHLSMEFFKLSTGIDVTHIPYKGASPAVADLVGGQIPVMIGNLPAMLPHIGSGRARALAITGEKRAAQIPDVPTMVESGLAGFVVTAWYGMCTPPGTPVAILDKLHADVTRVLQAPDVQQRLSDQVIDAAPTTREGYSEFIRAEIDRWAKVVRQAGITAQ